MWLEHVFPFQVLTKTIPFLVRFSSSRRMSKKSASSGLRRFDLLRSLFAINHHVSQAQYTFESVLSFKVHSNELFKGIECTFKSVLMYFER